jgi:hypothetical protein
MPRLASAKLHCSFSTATYENVWLWCAHWKYCWKYIKERKHWKTYWGDIVYFYSIFDFFFFCFLLFARKKSFLLTGFTTYHTYHIDILVFTTTHIRIFPLSLKFFFRFYSLLSGGGCIRCNTNRFDHNWGSKGTHNERVPCSCVWIHRALSTWPQFLNSLCIRIQSKHWEAQ